MCVWRERAESHTNLYVVSPCSFLQVVSGTKEEETKGREISIPAELHSFIQTFPLMFMGGIKAPKKKREKEAEKKGTLKSTGFSVLQAHASYGRAQASEAL